MSDNRLTESIERAAPVVGHVADAISTTLVLKGGGRELNPLLRPVVGNIGVFFAIKAGFGLAQALAVKRLQDSGHPKWARIFAAVAFGVPAAATIHNVRAL